MVLPQALVQVLNYRDPLRLMRHKDKCARDGQLAFRIGKERGKLGSKKDETLYITTRNLIVVQYRRQGLLAMSGAECRTPCAYSMLAARSFSLVALFGTSSGSMRHSGFLPSGLNLSVHCNQSTAQEGHLVSYRIVGLNRGRDQNMGKRGKDSRGISFL